MLRIGYGEGSFENLRNRGDLYIDKTAFIPLMERFPKFFFIRPRRFGKSLHLSMLHSYYDRNATHKFDTLFNGLYIQKNPTMYKNSYLILRFNFSGIGGRTETDLEISFNQHVRGEIDLFLTLYSSVLGKEPVLKFNELFKTSSASNMLDFLKEEVQKTDYKVYVLIDEYDQFINTLVSEGKETFVRKLVARSGFVRTFYEKLKIGSDTGVFDKFFITGVSPIMLDELSSGFNVTSNMSTDSDFNEMLGFTEAEVRGILNLIPDDKFVKKSREQVFQDMLELYNGYLFSQDSDQTLFNSDMVLYFVEKFDRLGKYPRELLDLNVKTDYDKLRGLIIGVSGQRELQETIEEISMNQGSQFILQPRFTFQHRFGKDELRSLLFYLGLLTFGLEPMTFVIPNQVIQILYWEYLQKFLMEEKQIAFDTDILHKTLFEMSKEGGIESLKLLVSDFYQNKLSNYDFSNHSEKHVKFMLVSYFTLSNLYNIVSERELPSGKRLDLLLEAHPAYSEYIKFNYILELKYINKARDMEQDSIREQAILQAREYKSLYNEHFQRIEQSIKAVVILIKHTRETEVFEV